MNNVVHYRDYSRAAHWANMETRNITRRQNEQLAAEIAAAVELLGNAPSEMAFPDLSYRPESA